jgi:hypothetical protein
MPRHDKTLNLINAAKEILAAFRPMTVRQVYYQLVSRQVIKNNRSEYQAVSKALVQARQEGIIPWEWLEDRLRRPRSVGMWDDLADFSEAAVRAYRRDVWATQENYLEVWLEKDALSGIFESILNTYGVTLNVGRGYDGWDSIYHAAMRFGRRDNTAILYFGDLDPSGEDMVRSLKERLGFFGCRPEIIKCALNPDDVKRYTLPPAFTKTTDTRSAAYIKEFGDMAVELDALPADVLETRLKNEVEARLDMAELEEVQKLEQADKATLKAALGGGI